MESTSEPKKNRGPENGTPDSVPIPLDPSLLKMAGWEIAEKPPISERFSTIDPASFSEVPDRAAVLSAPLKRSKSPLRLRYEAEVSVIKKKLGDLEAIRDSLGLTQRKMSQLLFVDPSAWTRWTRGGDEPPPHIYRMLQWYLALNEKYPTLDVNFWLQSVARIQDPGAESRAEIAELRKRLQELSDELKTSDQKAEERIRELSEAHGREVEKIRSEAEKLAKNERRRATLRFFIALFLFFVAGAAAFIFSRL